MSRRTRRVSSFRVPFLSTNFSSCRYFQIIVSHHIELLLPIAHSVIHVVDGKIEAQGTVAELRANGHLSAIVAEVEKAHIEEETVVDETPGKKDLVALDAVKPKKIAKKLTEDEDRAKGRVTVSRVFSFSREGSSSGLKLHLGPLTSVLLSTGSISSKHTRSVSTLSSSRSDADPRSLP